MLDSRHLRTFLGVVAAGSFSAAARRLGMTQPGVSGHMAQLEDELGTLLAHRRPRGIELTPAGQELLVHARDRLAAEEALRQRIQRDDPHRGECRLASQGSFGLYAYERLLELQEQHPGLSVHFAFAPNRTIRRQVREGELDLGFVTGQVDEGDLTAERIGSETLQILVPRGSGIEEYADLVALGFIGHPDGHDYATRALRAHFGTEFRGVDALPRTGFSNQIGLILAPVARGLGFTVLPDHAVATSVYRDRVDVLPTPAPVTDPIWAIWRGDREVPARYAKIIGWLGSCCRNPQPFSE